MKNIPIGEVLKEKGYITEEQLQAALSYQKEHRDSGKRLGAVLIDMGFITDRQLLTAMGDKLNMRILSLETFPIDAEAVKKIPRPLAAKYHALAVAADGRRLSVVINDPLDFYGIEDIRQVTGMTLDISLAENVCL